MVKRISFFAITLLVLGLAACIPSPHEKMGDEFYASQDYVRALQNYQMALPTTRQAAARKDLEDKIRTTKANLARMSIAKAESVAGAADPDKLSGVKKAIQALEEAVPWDSEQQEVQEKLIFYRERMNELEQEKQKLRQDSLQLIANYDFPGALKAVQASQNIDRFDPDSQNIAERIVELHELNQSIVQSLNNKQIDQARDAFARMQAISPISLSFANYPLRSTITDLVRSRIRDMELQNRWYEAYELLSMLDLDDFSQDMQRVRSSGAQYYYQRSSVAILDYNDHFHAYLLAVLASRLDESNMRVFRRLQETQDHVNRSIQSYIAVATFDSPSNDPDAGRQFSDSLISYLYSVLPYGINILERDKIDYLLKEQYADNRTAGQMLGVDLMVTGSVSLFRVDTNIDKRSATANVKVGEESLPNPEYQQMMLLHGPDTTLWPVVPPMMITRDRTQIMSYSRGTAETRGFAKVSVRIFDTDKGAISFVKDFDANVAFDSEFQDEVNEAGIEYKPMRLPSETEVKEQMRREIVTQVAQVVQSSFEAREHRFLNLARFYLERREPQMAIKPIAQGHYYALQDGIPEDDPAFSQIARLLPELAVLSFNTSHALTEAEGPVGGTEDEPSAADDGGGI